MRNLLAALLLSLASTVALAGEVVVVFGAQWCRACKEFHRDYEANQSIAGGRPLVIVDVDKDRDTARLFGVRAMPTFVVVEGDVIPANAKRRTVGYDGPKAFRAWVNGR